MDGTYAQSSRVLHGMGSTRCDCPKAGGFDARVPLPACWLHISLVCMANIVNLEETPGKVVGRSRGNDDSFTAYRRIVAMADLLRPRSPYPRGVFRFKTHEEAHEWKMKHMIQAAR